MKTYANPYNNIQIRTQGNEVFVARNCPSCHQYYDSRYHGECPMEQKHEKEGFKELGAVEVNSPVSPLRTRVSIFTCNRCGVLVSNSCTGQHRFSHTSLGGGC